MKYVLVTVSRDIINEVTFYNEQFMAIQKLSVFVKAMNPEHHDAAVFGPEGLIANAKDFLDENEQYVEGSPEDILISDEMEESIYIIANPEHRLGFMVASPDDPLGYKSPVAAISDLGQMRKDYGAHLKLYIVEPVNGPVVNMKDLAKYNKDCEAEDFDYSLVNEYLNELS